MRLNEMIFSCEGRIDDDPVCMMDGRGNRCGGPNVPEEFPFTFTVIPLRPHMPSMKASSALRRRQSFSRFTV